MNWIKIARVECPSCGATLRVSRRAQRVVCDYCGTGSTVEHTGGVHPRTAEPVIRVASPARIGALLTLLAFGIFASIMLPTVLVLRGAASRLWGAGAETSEAVAQVADALSDAREEVDRISQPSPEKPPEASEIITGKHGEYAERPEIIADAFRQRFGAGVKVFTLRLSRSSASAFILHEGQQYMFDSTPGHTRVHKMDVPPRQRPIAIERIDLRGLPRLIRRAKAALDPKATLLSAVMHRRADGTVAWRFVVAKGTEHYRVSGSPEDLRVSEPARIRYANNSDES